MTIEKAIDVLRGMELYLCSGNPIWKTDSIKEAVNMACEALKQTDTPQTDRMTEEEIDTMLAKVLVGQTDCDRYVIVNDKGKRAYNCIGCQTDCPWK